MGSIRMR